MERNLQDAMSAVRNIAMDPRIVPGGGATELAVGHAIRQAAKQIEGVHQWPYIAVANALEIIPRTLIENCGANVIRTITSLRARHASVHCTRAPRVAGRSRARFAARASPMTNSGA
jgi:T-complex protein 1 subunit gamma